MRIILAVLLLASSAFCATYTSKKFILDFSGGMNTEIDAARIADNQCATGSQDILTDNLILESRPGSAHRYTLPMAGDTPVYYQGEFRLANGVWQYFVQCGSVVFVSKDGGTNWLTVHTGLSTAYPIQAAALKNDVYFFNGVNDVFSYDGQSTSTHTFIPKGRYVVSFLNRLWVSGISAEPNAIYYSLPGEDPGNVESWLTTKAHKINEDDGDYIRGMAVWYNKLMAFKSYSTYIVGSDYAQLVSPSMGCKDEGSIAANAQAIRFLGHEGLFEFNNGFTPLTNQIRTAIKGINVLNTELHTWTLRNTDDFNEGTKDRVQTSSDVVSLQWYSKTWDDDTDWSAGTLSYTQASDDVLTLSTASVPSNTVLSPNINIVPEYAYSPDAVKDMLNAVDSDSGTAASITFKASYALGSMKVGGQNVTYWTGVSGCDAYALELSLGKRYNINEIHWSYSVDIDNYTDYMYVLVEYYDEGNNKWQTLCNEGLWEPQYNRMIENGVTVAPFPKNTCWTQDIGNFQWEQYKVNHWNGVFYAQGQRASKIRIRLATLPPASNTGSIGPLGTLVGIASGRFESITFRLFEVKIHGTTDVDNYCSTGTFISDVYDSGISTPRWGVFDALVSTGTGTILDFFVRTDADNASWEDWSSITPGTTMYSVDAERYIQWKASFTSTDNEAHPIIYSVTLNALASSGTYTSTTFYLDSLSSYQVFDVDDYDDDQTIAYYIRSGATAAGCTSANWTRIYNGDTPSESTSNKYVQWRSTYVTTRGDFNPYTRGVTIGWYKGSKGVPTTSAMHSGRYYFGCADDVNYNNVVYGVDRNNAVFKWTGMYPGAMMVDHTDRLMVGSSTGNVIYQYMSGTADAAAAISPAWYSKVYEYIGGIEDIGKTKHLKTITVVGKSADGNIPVYVGFRDPSEGSWHDYAVYLSTSFASEYEYKIDNVRQFSPRYSWQTRIHSTAANADWQVRAVVLKFDIMDDRQSSK